MEGMEYGPVLRASNTQAVSPLEEIQNENGLYVKLRISSAAQQEEMDESTESKPNKGLNHGIRPSQKEIDEHERMHVPFR